MGDHPPHFRVLVLRLRWRAENGQSGVKKAIFRNSQIMYKTAYPVTASTYVDILDRGSLAEVLRTEMQRRGLNQLQTAKVLGIAQGTISKLLRGRRPSLHRTAVYRIAEFLPPHESSRLEEALLGPEAREMLKAHQAWLDESLRPYREPLPIAYPEHEQELTRSVSPPWTWNLRGWNAFTAYIHLRSDPEAGQEIRRFEREVAKLGFTGDTDNLTADRHHLAFIRVFDPIAGDRGGRVERHYEELRESGELGKYLKHAFDRELILLRRASDLRRGQEWGALLRGVRPPP